MADLHPDISPEDLEAATLRLVRRPIQGAGLLLATIAPLLIVPGWLLVFAGLSDTPPLPPEPSLLILALTVSVGSATARVASRDQLSTRAIRVSWFAAASIPGAIALFSNWREPAQLAELVNDFPVLVWAATVGSSAVLLNPRLSLGLGVWCTLQYALIFRAAQPHLAELSGPTALVAVLSQPGAAARRSLILLSTGALAALLAGTLRRAIYELLEAQRQRLEEAQRRARTEAVSAAKTRFLADLSHELRTPLNAVLGNAQLLPGAAGGDVERRAQIIIDNGRHLAAVLGDAMDTALVEGGRLDLRVEGVDLRALVRSAVEGFALQAEAAGVRLEIDLDPARPAAALADARRLRQVLVNLVSNALKHAAPSRVRVRVVTDGAERWVVEVRDDGVGLDAAAASRIFEPYARLGAPETRAPGAGLGLDISRALVEAMRGTLTVSSAPGDGSAFRVSLRAAPAEARPDLLGPAPAPAESPLTLPDPAICAELEELALRGDMVGLKAALSQLDDAPALGPFLRRARAAAAAFDDEALLALFTPHTEGPRGS